MTFRSGNSFSESEHQAAKDLPEIIAILEKAAKWDCVSGNREKFGGSDLDLIQNIYMEAFAYGFSLPLL